MKRTKTSPRRTTKILGQTVVVGSRLHESLMAQTKHFNDLSKYETGRTR